jgi:hypothetical protein
MISSGNASFSPTVTARNGRHMVENPSPVTPLAVADMKKIAKIAVIWPAEYSKIMSLSILQEDLPARNGANLYFW